MSRNRRGNRATACNQNNGCGHDGGQCHNPQHPVFLHGPHWPTACALGRPIQPDCPIKTVSGISQHRRQGQRRGWPISWMQHKERAGVPAHWDAPLIMPAGQLWRSISPGWHEQIGGHCFPNFVGQGGFNSAGFSLNRRQASVRMCRLGQRHSPGGTIHLPTNMYEAPAFDNRGLMTLQLAARRG